MTPAEISTAITSIKTATEIVKGIIALNKDVEIKQKADDLLDVIISLKFMIIDLQSKYNEITKTKSDIEKKYMELLSWDKTASQYELKEITTGVFVYIPNESHHPAGAKYWLCTNCFESQQKSILQFDKKFMSRDQYVCPRCKNSIRVPSKDGGIQAAIIKYGQ